MTKRKISQRVLEAVSKVLLNPENSKKAKVAAGSALTQRPPKKKENYYARRLLRRLW